MATNYTTLLGFALPTTGELSGTWGDVVNASITELVEDAIAGAATADVTSGDWTLTTTGSGAANQARSAILIPTGTPGTSRNITAPSSSKAYIVENKSDGAVVVKGAATTGATVAAGTTALVAWDGSDFVLVAQDLANAQGTLVVAKGGTGANTLTGYVKGSGTSALTASATIPNTDITGLGTMSTQNANNVNIDGGTIDGVTIGGASAGAGTFTTATATTGNITTVNSTTTNATTVDATNIEVTNIKAKDGTAVISIADSTGVTTQSTPAIISTNSSIDALRITQVGSGNALVVEDSTNPDSTPFIVSANGNVGIGAVSASEKLFVEGNVWMQTPGPNFLINDTGSTTDNKLLSLRLYSGEYRLQYLTDAGVGGDYVQFTRSGNDVLGMAFYDGAVLKNFISNNGDSYFTSGNVLFGKTTLNFATEGAEYQASSSLLNLTRSGGSPLNLRRNASDGAVAVFYRDASIVGSISVTTSATAYNTSSDYRLKEDVQPMSGNIDRLMALNPVNFAWKVDGSRVDGFLAHEAQEIVPEAVTGTKDAVDDEGNPDYQGIDQSKLVPLLTAALQDAIREINHLKSEVEALKGN